MSTAIYKYALPYNIGEEFEIALPWVAKPLSVGFQGPNLVLWALVNTSADIVKATILVLWTGSLSISYEKLDSRFNFIGTTTGPIGLVYHVFIKKVERIER